MAYGLERNEVEDSEEHTADSLEQDGAWETSGGSFVAFGGPLDPSGNRVPDTFFFPLDLQLGDSGNKQIKKIPISHRTLLAFRDKLDRDIEQG